MVGECARQLVHVIDLNRRERSLKGEPIDLGGSGETQVLEREPMVGARVLFLEPFERGEHHLDAAVTARMHVDLEPRSPQGAGDGGEPLRRGQPLAATSVLVAGRLELEQFGEEAAVGEDLHVVAEPQTVGVALRIRQDALDEVGIGRGVSLVAE